MTAQEYQENIDLQKSDRASMMDGNGATIICHHKKLKVGHINEGHNDESVQSVVNENMYIINISSEAVGRYSFLHGLNGGLAYNHDRAGE